MNESSLDGYQARKNALLEQLKSVHGRMRMTKRTSSNLFRYGPRQKNDGQAVSLAPFHHVLKLDAAAKTLTVEGLATFEEIVTYTIPHGFVPNITPELKHITIGGATVGIGIESAGFKHGFVHDSLLEAEVLLHDGRIVSCTRDNEHADLLNALPNSYGTLGYILKVTLALTPAKPYIEITNVKYNDVDTYIKAMKAATEDPAIDFIEGLFFNKQELYCTTGRFTDKPGAKQVDIYGKLPYYKELRQANKFTQPTAEYIFRFDPDWFWNVPETGLYGLFRRFGSKNMRSSKFFNRYVHHKNRILRKLGIKEDKSEEQLIQDWEIPWARANEFVNYLLEQVDIQDQPWVALPIKPLSKPTLYPVKPGAMLFNVGCYCYTKRPDVEEDYHYTKILDTKCFELGGIKMLYSSTFLEKNAFDALYNGKAYAKLKEKYDPNGFAPTLFEKAVQSA